MQTNKRILSILLTLALAAGLLAIAPITASAVGTNVAIAQADSVSTIQANIQNAIDGIATGETVTVTGSKTDADIQLYLEIPEGKTVKWEADYAGSVYMDTLVFCNWLGLMEIAGGSIINECDTPHPNPDLGVCNHTFIGGHILVSDGKVRAAYGVAIYANRSVTVRGGEVSAADGTAIHTIGPGNKIEISGGTVSTADGIAIHANEVSDIVVSGGTVSANNGNAISSNGGEITISGGTVSAGSSPINVSNCNVKVSGGEVKATGFGHAISTGSDDGNIGIEVSGGTVSSASGCALYTFPRGDIVVSGGMVSSGSTTGGVILANGNVTVSDGVVKSAGPSAITTGMSGKIAVSGGVVSSALGTAISAHADITISGGLVFGRGKQLRGPSSGVIVNTGGTTSKTGSAVVVEWKADAAKNYSQGTTTHLDMKSSNSATWHNNGTASGIKYGTDGFFAVDGVTVHPYKVIFGTRYEANLLNWILFFIGFGFIWMWF